MARYKAYDYDQLVMVPVCLEDQLVPGTLEHTIHFVVENRLDLSRFDERYRNDETGRCAYDPRVLLKIVLLGYARGLLSSRDGNDAGNIGPMMEGATAALAVVEQEESPLTGKIISADTSYYSV